MHATHGRVSRCGASACKHTRLPQRQTSLLGLGLCRERSKQEGDGERNRSFHSKVHWKKGETRSARRTAQDRQCSQIIPISLNIDIEVYMVTSW